MESCLIRSENLLDCKRSVKNVCNCFKNRPGGDRLSRGLFHLQDGFEIEVSFAATPTSHVLIKPHHLLGNNLGVHLVQDVLKRHNIVVDPHGRTNAHPVSSHPGTKMLGSLSGGNRLFDSFKYIQLNPPENKKAPVILKKKMASA